MTFLYAAMFGASLWTLTEILEVLAPAGYTPLSLSLTTLWHPFVAAGFWGLHKAQSPRRNTLSLIGTIAIIAGFLVFAPISVMFLASGETSLSGFMDARPYVAAAGSLLILGIVTFAAAMLRSRFYPAWMAYALVAGFAAATIKKVAGLSESWQHAGFILVCATMIAMALSARAPYREADRWS
jgi:hypothetical protein